VSANVPTGYRLRWATPDDAEALAELADLAHGADESDGRAPWVAQWVRDLMSPSHPTGAGEHIAVVEHLATGRAASMAGVIPQTWTVGGAPVTVGRLEAFGTHPDHRRRGLVRVLMDALHERCDELGAHLVVISGLGGFYRQFGYDYALEHEGGLGVPPTSDTCGLPALSLRPMGPADVSAAAARYDAAAKDSFVWCPRPEAVWCQALRGHHDPSHEAERWWVIEQDRDAVGHLAHLPRLDAGALTVTELLVDEAAPPADALGPAVLAALGSVTPGLTGAYLRLGSDDPSYAGWASGTTLPIRPYAWFVRVPDWVRFFQATTAAFRLPDRCEVRLGEYVRGVRLVVGSDGIESAEAVSGELADASFPPGTLAKLVLGYRSVEQLLDAYPDVEVGAVGGLLAALFPRRRSFVRPVS
jgi:GNAT superfamily N-acetyltransferase